MPEPSSALRVLNQEIVSCRKCPRLVKYREKVAREKRRAYRDCEYWGKPVPGFGDGQAQLLILGLAPAAHGKIAWDAYLKILKQRGVIASRTPYRFAHGAEAEVAPETPRLFAVYHPSQQNTQTGRVTPAMYCKVLARIRRFLETLPASFKPISRS